MDGPLLGIPTANGRSQALLSAHLGYGTSLLTGLPAFSLSQSQLLLHTAARVSSLKHKPERVIPPLKGQAPHCPWDRQESMPENRSPSTWSVLYLSKGLLCPLRLGSGLCPAQPSSPQPLPGVPSTESSVGLMLCLWAQTEHLLCPRWLPLTVRSTTLEGKGGKGEGGKGSHRPEEESETCKWRL